MTCLVKKSQFSVIYERSATISADDDAKSYYNVISIE